MTIRLVAVDLDGTLLTSAKQLAPLGSRLLGDAQRAGARVVLATARNAGVVREFCRGLGLVGPMICTNGAQILSTPDGPLWADHTIPRAAALELARLADRQGWELTITVGAITYWRQRPGQPLGPLAPDRVVVRSNSEMVTGDAIRILTWQSEAVAPLYSLCNGIYAEACRAEVFVDQDGQPQSAGVFPRLADKGTALRLVLERCEISGADVLAIGDNYSDVPMFAVAGVSVAMGNASAPVKASAAAVAPGNDEEGVAWALQKFFFEGLKND